MQHLTIRGWRRLPALALPLLLPRSFGGRDDLEADHYPTLEVLGDVAACPLQPGIGDIEPDVDGLTGAQEHDVLSHEVGFRPSLERTSKLPAPGMSNGWCIG